MRLIPFVMVVAFLASCQPEFESVNPYSFVDRDLKAFSPLMNAGKAQKPKDKTIVLANDRYPIDISLFTDGNFYYNLTNLGDGYGTWTHKEGHLQLYAERKLFVMNMDIHHAKEIPDKLVVHFVDRFGTQYLPLNVTQQ